jgi:K+-sensing histidine kinase KdpD
VKAGDPLSDILPVLGHDLSNELAAASLMTTMLRRDAMSGASVDEAAFADLDSVLATMRRKVDCALALRRLIEGAPEPSQDRLDGAAIIAGIAAAIGVAADGAAGCLIDADRGLLEDALRGIVSRAAFVSRAATDVRIRVANADGHVRFSVDDSGPGEEVARITALLSVDGCALDRGAASIELAFARIVAELHGGRMTVGPSDAGGAAVSITLPAAEVEPARGTDDPHHA